MKNRTVDRALSVLELIAESKNGLTQARIAESLDIPKSTLHSFLSALESKRYLKQDSHGVYSLDMAVLALGNAYLDSTDLSQELRAILIRISKELNITAHLAALDGTNVMYVDKIDPAGSHIRLASAIGTRLPSHLTAVGRACLVLLPESQLRRHLDLSKVELGEREMGLEELHEELKKTQMRGYAVEHGTLLAGVTCVAVPLSAPEQFSGSLGVSFLTESAEVGAAARVLLRASQEIARNVSLRSYR